MKFDEFGYPNYIKKISAMRDCEHCKKGTFWRYDFPRGDLGGLFFPACSSECLEEILKPRKQAVEAIHKVVGWTI